MFAACELALAFFPGGFATWGRAESLLFFGFRPWVLLACAVLVADRPWRERWTVYTAVLLLATLSELIFLTMLGGRPLADQARGLLAGFLLVATLDVLMAAGRRAVRTKGRWLGAGAGLALLLIPGALTPYDALVLRAEGDAHTQPRPALLLMSALPLAWGETGPLDPRSRPAEAYRLLKQHFDIQPLDAAEPDALAGQRVMLLAQPRLLAPEELVAIDNWVRRGGRALVLADPALLWPSALPPDDVRRPPARTLLTPILDHWGVQLEAGSTGASAELVTIGGVARRMMLAGSGTLTATKPSCRPLRSWAASCRLGRGRAVVVADADLLEDGTWVRPSPRGSERALRLSDNPHAVVDLLHLLDGGTGPAAGSLVQWRAPGASLLPAILAALLPLLLASLAAVPLRRRG